MYGANHLSPERVSDQSEAIYPEISSNTSRILEYPKLTSISIDKDSAVFDYLKEEGYQRSSFLESAYSTLPKTKGYIIATKLFLDWFQQRNKKMPGFQNYNFGEQEKSSIGHASFINQDGKREISPIYLLGKDGEGVLGEEGVANFYQDMQEIFGQK